MRVPADLVIFDCDGVLVDSEPISCRVDAECLAEVGIAVTAQEVMERYVGISVSSMCADIEARHGRRLPADLVERMRARTAAAFDAELVAIPGVRGVLDALRSARCVASSSAPERIRHSLGLTGLLSWFEPNIFSATQVARGKPAPDLFEFAAARMGVAPARSIVIEDSQAGVLAARAAGMRVFGFVGASHCGAGHAAKLLNAGAAATFADMRELPALLGIEGTGGF